MSGAISVARVICIFFVMFVHVWPGHAQVDVATYGVRGIDHLFRFVTTVLGHSSVPLLSIVSGYLLASSYAGRWRHLLSTRATTLLLPLVLWNAVMVASLLGGAALGVSKWQHPETMLGWADALLAWHALSANMPVAFLRDLFVCVALAPLLLPLLVGRPTGAVALIALATLFAIFGPQGFPLVRPMILPFFLTGAALCAHRIDAGRALAVPAALGAAAGVALVIFVADSLGVAEAGDAAAVGLTPAVLAKSMLMRLAVAYLFWCSALWIGAKPFGCWLSRLEPYIFFVFCSHPIIIKLLSVPGAQIFGGYYSPAYPLFFLLQPLLSLVIGVVAARTLRRWAPDLLRMLNAGRTVPVFPPYAVAAGDVQAVRR